METDTPRTDAAGLLGFAETADLCERLERELAAANARIAELESEVKRAESKANFWFNTKGDS